MLLQNVAIKFSFSLCDVVGGRFFAVFFFFCFGSFVLAGVVFLLFSIAIVYALYIWWTIAVCIAHAPTTVQTKRHRQWTQRTAIIFICHDIMLMVLLFVIAIPNFFRYGSDGYINLCLSVWVSVCALIVGALVCFCCRFQVSGHFASFVKLSGRQRLKQREREREFEGKNEERKRTSKAEKLLI